MLRRARMRCAALASMPGEVVAHLDEAIEDLTNAMHLERAALALSGWASIR